MTIRIRCRYIDMGIRYIDFLNLLKYKCHNKYLINRVATFVPTIASNRCVCVCV